MHNAPKLLGLSLAPKPCALCSPPLKNDKKHIPPETPGSWRQDLGVQSCSASLNSLPSQGCAQRMSGKARRLWAPERASALAPGGQFAPEEAWRGPPQPYGSSPEWTASTWNSSSWPLAVTKNTGL